MSSLVSLLLKKSFHIFFRNLALTDGAIDNYHEFFLIFKNILN